MFSGSIGTRERGLFPNEIAYTQWEITYENHWSGFIRLPFATAVRKKRVQVRHEFFSIQNVIQNYQQTRGFRLIRQSSLSSSFTIVSLIAVFTAGEKWIENPSVKKTLCWLKRTFHGWPVTCLVVKSHVEYV